MHLPLLSLTALLLVAPAALASPAPAPAPIVGGWSEIPRAQLKAEVGAAARFAVSRLPGRHGKLKTIANIGKVCPLLALLTTLTAP